MKESHINRTRPAVKIIGAAVVKNVKNRSLKTNNLKTNKQSFE